MTAYKCDACGTLYESYKDEDNYKILRDEGKGVYRCETKLDICPKCLKKIKDCIESGNKEESSTQPEKDKTSFNATTIDASQLKCPCYSCLDWNEKLLRCKGIQRDCIKYHNWYSNTFNY